MMRLPHPASCAAIALVTWAAAATASAHVQTPSPTHVGSRAGTPLLDVPFLPQTEDLCGGAAVAMVMRYWGEPRIYPDDFAPLVDRGLAGIRTDVLVADIARRGWRAVPLAADGAGIREHVSLGRPVIALVEVRPGRYHYVVIVAWTATHVIAHDPARAPFQLLSHAEFDRMAVATDRWAVVVLPGAERHTPPIPAPRAPSSLPSDTEIAAADSGACGPFVQSLVGLARAGDLAAAAQGLQSATALCPEDAAAWRELAGVRFLQSRWADAAAAAEHAAGLDPADSPTWDLAATSRFLNDEPEAALASWNRIGRPVVDVVRIEGAARTRQPVVAGAIGLLPRSVLTPARFDRAARRLQALPSASLTRLRYRPLADGAAQIDAVTVERPVTPRGVVPLAALAARAALHREATLDVASPTGSGELWSASWRWWQRRPRVAFALAVPEVKALPGVVTVEGLWENASYATALSADRAEVVQQERRRAGFHVTDWATGYARWRAGLAFDRWIDDGYLSLDAGIDTRSAGDRLALGVDGASWFPLGSGRRFARASLWLAARSTSDAARAGWWLRTGLEQATGAAPFDLWAGAGTGLARTPLLRAHPLLDDGVVVGAVFGRRLAHGSIEYQRPVLTRAAGAVRAAVFLDLARAWQPADVIRRDRWHSDAGIGLRFSLPGNGGALRLDAARGLRDGRHVLSAAWLAPWPNR